MTPLKGGSYTNIFSHYRPVGDPLWYTRPNPPETPAPILDLDTAFLAYEMRCTNPDTESLGETPQWCTAPHSPHDSFEGSRGSYEERKQQWVELMMPFLSPHTNPITGGEGMFQHWKKVNQIAE
jgi:hypothetical protein